MPDVTSRPLRRPSTQPLSRGRDWLLLLVLAVLPYINGLHNDFVYDDHALITENGAVRSLDPRQLLRPSLERHAVEWHRPLTMLSLAINYRWSGLVPFGYHLTNLLLHVANVWLLYAIGCRVLQRRTAALIAAGLFAVHALHVEAVTPVSGRADLLATGLVLVAWLLALTAEGRWQWPRAAVVGLSAAAAFLAKESAIVVWPLLVVSHAAGLGVTARGDRDRSAIRLYAAIAVALVAVAAIRFTSTGGVIAASSVAVRAIENPLSSAPLGPRLATAIWILFCYLRLLVLPTGLSADYSFHQIPVLDSWHDPRLLLAALLAVATIAATALAWRRHRLAATLVLLFVLLWLPVSNTLVLIGTIMGERLMYLPSIAFALLVGALVRQLTPDTDRLSPRLMTGAAAVAVVHIGLAVSRNVEWRTQDALFRATVERSPRSVKAHFNYGVELQAHGRSEDAATHFHAALALAPDYPEANNALGTVLLAAQDLAGAEARFRAALSAEPGFARAWLNLGTALFRAGRDSEARPALQRALQLDDRLVIAHATLGALAERAHDRDGAIDHYQTAYGLAPDFEGLGPHLAELLVAAGRGDQARIVLTEVERRRSQARPSTTSRP